MVYPGHWDGGRFGRLIWPKVQQVVMGEAGVARPAVGVQDVEGRPPAGWTGAIARDDHLRSLANHVPAKPDPRRPGQLQPDSSRLADGGADATPRGGLAGALEAGRLEARRFEDEERDPGSAREGGKAAESIGESRFRGVLPGAWRRVWQPARQVDDEEVNRPAREECAGDRETLLRFHRGQHDQPLGLDAARDGLDRIQGLRQVQPGDDGAGRLRLRRESEREGGPPAGGIAPQRHAHAPWHAPRTEDGVQLREPRREDPIGVRQPPRCPSRIRVSERLQRHGCERADDIAGIPGRGRSPARSKRREGCVQVRGGSRHALSIEQTFE
jgi:hypothetical protein